MLGITSEEHFIGDRLSEMGKVLLVTWHLSVPAMLSNLSTDADVQSRDAQVGGGG